MPEHFFSHLRSLRTRLMLWNAGAVAATGLMAAAAAAFAAEWLGRH